MSALPSLFVSHGTPMLALADDDFTESLRRFAEHLPEKPQAIVVVSAHGTSNDHSVEVTAGTRNHLVYDFKGFPGELYQMEYPCPGAPELAVKIAGLLSSAAFEVSLDTSGGLDHGVWIPLRLMFPEADIPVIQIATPLRADAAQLLKIGKALAPLRNEGVLLMGSGGAVHNLRELQWHQKNAQAQPWAAEFERWLIKTLIKKDVDALIHFAEEAPQAALAHPTSEHFLPILFTVGSALSGDQAIPIYEGVQYETLSMLSFALSEKKTEN
jgi:4,5-DOPA dioxygenase extradiol